MAKNKFLFFFLSLICSIGLLCSCNGNVDEKLLGGSSNGARVIVTFGTSSSKSLSKAISGDEVIIPVPSRVVKKSFLADNSLTANTIVQLEFIGISQIEGNSNDGTTFAGCTSLTSVIMDEALKDIGEYAFYQTSGGQLPIETLKMAGVERIGTYAFNGCTKLKNVTFPTTVSLIEQYAFHDCSELNTLIFLGSSTPTIETDAFNGTNLTNVVVKSGCKSDSATALGVSESIITESSFASYTVTFDSNNGSGESTTQVFTEGIADKLKENTFTGNSGQAFKSWNTSSDGNGTSYTDKADFTATGNITLFAQWSPAFTVTFNVMGKGTAPEAQVVAEGGKATKPDNPTTDDAMVTGWYKENTFVTEWNFDADTVTTDTTLYAKWNEIMPLGGTIFHDNGDNGVTYHFYTAKSFQSEVTNWEGLSPTSLTDATGFYLAEGTATTDRFYIYNTAIISADGYCWAKATDSSLDKTKIDTGTQNNLATPKSTTSVVGKGKTSTAYIFASKYTNANYSDSSTIWYYIKSINDNVANGTGCFDWYVPCMGELDKLYRAEIIQSNWVGSNNYCWSSSIGTADYSALMVSYSGFGYGTAATRNTVKGFVFPIRSF